MPEMQNLDEVGRFVHPIVDQDGGMHELEDTGKFSHSPTWLRIALPKRWAVVEN
jgi:hypothetical protein